MASQAVARAETPKVPDLVRTPALTITAEDVALPRIYIGQFMSKAVQRQEVKAGQIFAATGQDDPDPQVLWSPGDSEGVLFHVLGLRKGKSLSDGGELVLFDFDDPDAPPEASVTYNYTIAVPDIDTDVPFKLLLTRTGTPAARNINTILKKNQNTGPAWASAFRMTAAERENAKGKFYVARVGQVEATVANIEASELLALMMSASSIEHVATGEQPAI